MSFVSPVDPDGLQEFSVVFTDRSLNHMSSTFQRVMTDINQTLKSAYTADHDAIVPGGGTFAMEAVARQFASEAKALVIRNGWFSYRWSQIFDASDIADHVDVIKAAQTGNDTQSPFAPAPIEMVTAAIKEHKPAVVFAPHVETSAGMILPDDYLSAVADAAHAVGAIFVLDCIASGCIWVDMQALGVDVLISAPQKGWSGTPCAGLVMMSDRAYGRMQETESSSFSMNLKTWANIMKAYENGGHAYHATMPTDGLRQMLVQMQEMAEIGFDELKSRQQDLGDKVRAFLESQGHKSVAAKGFKAPGVVVSYTDKSHFQNGSAFAAQGAQIAAGVPLQCDEPEGFSTFRIGLFGLDKLKDVDGTVARLRDVFQRVQG
ncbi:MAG: aminotransferase class V-fold PLP-dependent enzyme [Pseudomonadota bacterium]